MLKNADAMADVSPENEKAKADDLVPTTFLS
jgi:hypothetical protein